MLLNRRSFCRDMIAGVGATGLGLHTLGSLDATLAARGDQANPLANRLPAQSDWFLNGRYGLMISFSVYSLLGRGSWAIYLEQIPVHEYRKLLYQFNPTSFSAKDWVQLAKDAGQKYVTFVAKHRDGFSMFNTRLSDFSSCTRPSGETSALN